MFNPSVALELNASRNKHESEEEEKKLPGAPPWQGGQKVERVPSKSP